MSRKGRKGQPETGAELAQKSREIVRYQEPPKPVPLKVAVGVQEFFRSLGVDAEVDNHHGTNSVFAKFSDRSEIHVNGGKFGASIAFHFYSDLPRYAEPQRLLDIIKKIMYKRTMFAKLGYLDIKRMGGDHVTDMVALEKKLDTTSLTLVMADLRRITTLLGHNKEKRLRNRRK